MQELVEADFLKATSVGFAPIKFKFTSNPDRQFGIDFIEQELLEFSIVPVPANPDAVIAFGPGKSMTEDQWRKAERRAAPQEKPMTLEQKILHALAQGNQAVADGLLFGIFGPAAQRWFIGWVAEGRPEIEDFSAPPWCSVH